MAHPLPRKNLPKVSLVIPLFNEEAILPELIRLLQMLKKTIHCDGLEFILINDGSFDRTGQILFDFAKWEPSAKVIEFSRNFGHQSAISAGIEHSSGDAVIIMDGDLQDPVDLIPTMLTRYMEGYDVVYAQRIARHGETIAKRATARLFYWFMKNLVFSKLPENVGDFRLMSREATNAFLKLREGDRFVRGLVTWIGFSQVGVPFERAPRQKGHTKYSFVKMFGFAWSAIVSFSMLPLRLGLLLGAVFFVFSFGLLGWTFYNQLVLKSLISPWLPWMAFGFMLGSTILLYLGILGEYLGRVFKEIKNRPFYIIRRTANCEEQTKSQTESPTLLFRNKNG